MPQKEIKIEREKPNVIEFIDALDELGIHYSYNPDIVPSVKIFGYIKMAILDLESSLIYHLVLEQDITKGVDIKQYKDHILITLASLDAGKTYKFKFPTSIKTRYCFSELHILFF